MRLVPLALAAATLAGAGLAASPASARTFVSIGIGAPVYPAYYGGYYPAYYDDYYPGYYVPRPIYRGDWGGPRYWREGYYGRPRYWRGGGYGGWHHGYRRGWR